MKLTKNIVSLLLVAATTLSIAACSGDNSETTEAGASTTAAPAATTKVQTTTAPSSSVPTTPETTAPSTDEGITEMPEEDVYAGSWAFDNETGRYQSWYHENPNFAILPIGDGKVPDGVTKYSLEVTSIWGQRPEWGLVFGGNDIDGDGHLLENFDYYRMFLLNDKGPANCDNPGKFGNWDVLMIDHSPYEGLDVITMKVVVDTVAQTLEFYLNDIMIDSRTDQSFTGYGNMIGVASKIDYNGEWGEFWDIKFSAIN